MDSFKELFVCQQVKEEEDSRPKKPLQRKTAKTTEEGNAIEHKKFLCPQHSTSPPPPPPTTLRKGSFVHKIVPYTGRFHVWLIFIGPIYALSIRLPFPLT